MNYSARRRGLQRNARRRGYYLPSPPPPPELTTELRKAERRVMRRPNVVNKTILRSAQNFLHRFLCKVKVGSKVKCTNFRITSRRHRTVNSNTSKLFVSLFLAGMTDYAPPPPHTHTRGFSIAAPKRFGVPTDLKLSDFRTFQN